MASELSQLIESELRKAEGANKPDEHQRRLASLRIKTGIEKPPPGYVAELFQKYCTPKRQIIAAAVLITLVLILIVAAAVHHRHRSSTLGSQSLKPAFEGSGVTTASLQAPDVNGNTSSPVYDIIASSVSDDDPLAGEEEEVLP